MSARKTRNIMFEVEGKGIFPLDMLRYDRCYPARQEDVHEMQAISTTLRETVARKVRLVSHRDIGENMQPTIRRWESFGWRVTEWPV